MNRFDTRRAWKLLGQASPLILCAAIIGAPPAQAQEGRTQVAQTQLQPAQNPTIRTLGGGQRQDSPSDQAFRNFLREAHPVWARMTWQEALPNLEVLSVAGFPVGASVAERIAPEYVALDLSLALPFKNSSVTARRAYLLDGHLVLRGMQIENDSGRMTADFAVLSRDALRILGQYVTNQRPEADAPPLAGEIVLNAALAETPEFSGDRPGTGFASSLRADLLTFSGMSWGEGEDAPILVSGLRGENLSGQARFTARSDFTLGRFAFNGSLPDLTDALMQRIGRASVAEAADVEQRAEAAPAASSGSTPAGDATSAATAESDTPSETATVAFTPPPPVTHPFTASFSDLRFSATRDDGEPARISARGGAVDGSIVEGGAMQVTARVADMRSSSSVFAGTPLEELTQQIAERAGGSELRLDLAMEAGLDSDRLRVNVACIALPGLVDFATEVDVYVPGLERMLTQKGGRSEAGLDLLFASQARALSFELVDHGLNAALQASGVAPLGQLIQDTLLSRVESPQGGMRMMVLQSALAPFTQLLQQYDETGAVALGARFDSDTTLPVALVTFLQSSAQATATGAPDAGRCDAIPLRG